MKLKDVQPGQFFHNMTHLYLMVSSDWENDKNHYCAVLITQHYLPTPAVVDPLDLFGLCRWNKDWDMDVEIINPEDV